MTRHHLPAVLLLTCVVASLLAFPRDVLGVERNFAGSVQLDYHYVPTAFEPTRVLNTFDSFTPELSFKVAVDVSRHVSANLKVCYGCHGFELDMGYLDYRLADELNVRVGRFSPSFGAFNLRHDPANHYLSDKPLAYDMGRMLRVRDWNQGVLPSPFPDTGIEVNGTRWFGNDLQLDYAVYAIAGFKGDAAGLDLDFQQSRAPYYVDNNRRPTLGGRLAATFRLSPTSDVTLGASGQHGSFDPEARLAYAILGADASFRFGRTDLRFEYLVRRQDMSTASPNVFRYRIASQRGDFFVKHGAYVELRQPVANGFDLIGRVDGMYRAGNLANASALARRSTVLRYTVGSLIALEQGLRLKVSSELWDFSDVGESGHHTELSFHVAFVGTY